MERDPAPGRPRSELVDGDFRAPTRYPDPASRAPDASRHPNLGDSGREERRAPERQPPPAPPMALDRLPSPSGAAPRSEESVRSGPAGQRDSELRGRLPRPLRQRVQCPHDPSDRSAPLPMPPPCGGRTGRLPSARGPQRRREEHAPRRCRVPRGTRHFGPPRSRQETHEQFPGLGVESSRRRLGVRDRGRSPTAGRSAVRASRWFGLRPCSV